MLWSALSMAVQEDVMFVAVKTRNHSIVSKRWSVLFISHYVCGLGCGVLETLRISNINQPLPDQEEGMEANMEEDEDDDGGGDDDYEEEMGEEDLEQW